MMLRVAGAEARLGWGILTFFRVVRLLAPAEGVADKTGANGG